MVAGLFTRDDAIIALEGLATDLSDLMGRRVSVSGIIRALAIYASQRAHVWKVTKLLPIIEAQQRQVTWGRLSAKKPQ
jgi:hypothetical protein